MTGPVWTPAELEALAFAARTGGALRCPCDPEARAVTAEVRPEVRDVAIRCAACGRTGGYSYPSVRGERSSHAGLQESLALRWTALQRRVPPGGTIALPCPVDGTVIPVTVCEGAADHEITAWCFYCGRTFKT